MPELPELTLLLEEATAAGHPPAAAACVIAGGDLVHESAHGRSPSGDAVTPESVFDLASVTKIAATTLAIAALVESGRLSLDAPVAEWLPAFGARGKERVTVRELLGHRSGLPAWKPLFLEAEAAVRTRDFRSAREAVLAAVFDTPLGARRRLYSDLGFITLGVLVEAVSGEPLDLFVRERFYAPHGFELGFVDLSAPSSWLTGRMVLPTGRTRPREPTPGQEGLYTVQEQAPRDDAGEVDDDNAFAMGGVAGHAGLFGTARAVAELGWWIARAIEGDEQLGIGPTLRSFAELDPAEGLLRSLGFDRPAPRGSSVGSLFGRGPRGAIGHLGFTGCSLWIDLDRRISVALLTNRTYPGRSHVEPIRALRPTFHDALCRALD